MRVILKCNGFFTNVISPLGGRNEWKFFWGIFFDFIRLQIPIFGGQITEIPFYEIIMTFRAKNML